MRNGRRLTILLLLMALMLTSCQTGVVTEYVTVTPDITDVVEPVLMQRPDNSTVEVITDVQTVEDIVSNSVSYMYAWRMWETYADALETTIAAIRDRLAQ